MSIQDAYERAKSDLAAIYSTAAEADDLRAQLVSARSEVSDLRTRLDQLQSGQPNPTPNPLPVPTRRHRVGVAGWFSDAVSLFRAGLVEALISEFRGWITLGRKNGSNVFDPYRVNVGDFAAALLWRRAGMQTIGACVPAFGCYQEMRRLGNDFRQLPERHARAVAAGMDDSLDFVEVGNEPDLRGIYWTPGHEAFLLDYWTHFVRTLKRERPGVKVIAPALGNQGKLIEFVPAWAQLIRSLPADVQPDGIAIHMYPDSLDDLRRKLDACRQHLRPIAPLFATEWDCTKRAADWAAMIRPALAEIAETCESSDYYRIYDRDEAKADWDDVSLFTRAGAKTPFHAPFAAASKAVQNR